MAESKDVLGLDDLENTHPEYDENVVAWELIDDVCRGSRCVKAKGETYLPKLSGQTDAEFDAMKRRAKFFAASKRTKEALAGMLLRKTPAVETGGIPDPVIADVTLNGLDLVDYSRQVAAAIVSKGRAGTFIDFSETESVPYLAFYKAEDVINWASVRIHGREVLTMLVLREWEDFRDGFEVERRKRIRRYWLDTKNLDDADEENDEITLAVHCETWIEAVKENGKSFERETDETVLTRRGVPVPLIPFVFHNATTLGAEIGDAPLEDIAELNVSHYCTSADLENGRHFVGLPTPVVTGVDDIKELKIGSESAWIIENENAKAFFLEFEGSGLSELRLALEETADQMSQLGARLLFDQKKDAEAFETHELRAGAETAALSQIAGTASVSMTEVLQWVEWWGGTFEKLADSGASFLFNEDFIASSIPPTLLAELLKVYISGSMSFEAFFENLRKGELYPEGWDFEKERAAIATSQALPGPARTLVPDPEPDDKDDPDEDKDKPPAKK